MTPGGLATQLRVVIRNVTLQVMSGDPLIKEESIIHVFLLMNYMVQLTPGKNKSIHSNSNYIICDYITRVC